METNGPRQRRIGNGDFAMRICTDGEAESAIDIAGRVSEVERFAANELQKYIERISGATVPIRPCKGAKGGATIVLRCGAAADAYCSGTSPISKRREDSFAINVAENRLHLLGQNGRGLLFAVYGFLEDVLGVGFLAPSEENEWIPRRRTISLKPLRRLEEPSMKLRGFSCSLPQEVDWMAKNRMNYALVGADPHLIRAARLRGMRLYRAGHSFYLWLPPEKYWQSHPEYYSLIGGKRVCTYEQGEHMGHQQICVSHPDVIRIVSDNIISFIEEHPEYDFYPLWPNDADSWCECERCRRLDGEQANPFGHGPANTGSYVCFANQVAERVARRHPQKMLNIICYRSTIAPPSDPGVVLHPNLVVEVAHWGRPCDRPLGRPISDTTIKRRMRRADIGLERLDFWQRNYRAIDEILGRWGEIVKGELLVYDYMMASTSTLSLPYPMFRTVLEDHKFYRRAGVTGCYMQGHKSNSTAYGLNYWIGAKAYWGGPQNVSKLLDQYCQKRFGPGAAPMKEYFLTLERSFRSQTCGFYPYWVSRILRPEVVTRCRTALDAAQSRTRKNPHKDWLKRARLHFDYSLMLKLCYDACRETERLVKRQSEHEAFRWLIEAYNRTCRLYHHMAELEGHDILSAPRVVLYSLLRQEFKAAYGDICLGSAEAAERVADYLWPRLYDG